MTLINESQSLGQKLFQKAGIEQLRFGWIEQGILSAVSVIIVLSCIQKVFHVSFRNAIRDEQGNNILMLPMNARVLKFASSEVLSKKGQDLAGNRPYLIQNGNIRELVLTQQDHVRDFYKGNIKEHTKPLLLNMGYYFSGLLGHAVGAIAGDRWTVTRRYFDPVFSFKSSRESIPQFNRTIKDWIRSMAKKHQQSGDGGFTADVKTVCRTLPFKLAAQHIYGEGFSEKMFEDLLLLNELHEPILHDIILNTKLASRLSLWTDRTAAKNMKNYQIQWKNFTVNAIKHAQEQNLLCPALDIYEGVEKKEMTMEEFLHTLDEILFANIDVSSGVLNTLFSHLATMPELQDRVRKETSVLKTSDQAAIQAYFSKPDTLLNCTIMESMRMSPAFAFSLPECTSKTKNIGGYIVSAGTSVVIDARRINRDPDFWGSDSEQFRPERFREISPGKCRYSFMRFGIGAASGKCLGKNVADAIFKLTVVEVLDQYYLRAPEVSTEMSFLPL